MLAFGAAFLAEVVVLVSVSALATFGAAAFTVAGLLALTAVSALGAAFAVVALGAAGFLAGTALTAVVVLAVAVLVAVAFGATGLTTDSTATGSAAAACSVMAAFWADLGATLGVTELRSYYLRSCLLRTFSDDLLNQ